MTKNEDFRYLCVDLPGPWLNSTSSGGNDWVKPQDASTATSYFQGNGTLYTLNVYADTTQDVALPDGSRTSVLETILPDPSVRAQAVAALTDAASDYAGITIDFEGLRTDLLKADFVSFMTELRAALPSGRPFSCARIFSQPPHRYGVRTAKERTEYAGKTKDTAIRHIRPRVRRLL